MSLIISCSDNNGDPAQIDEQNVSFMKDWRIENSINAKEVVNKFDVFFFDCDGVLWKGNEVIEGAVEVIDKLIKANKKVYFITNNSSKSRDTLLKKFHMLGFFFVKKENIICTAYAIAKYFLSNENYTTKKKKIYVIGEKGICDELDAINVEWLGSYKDNDKNVIISDDFQLCVDKNIGAVVVAIDFNINYYKIQYAHLCINELDAEFIVTNKDVTANFNSKQKWAGTGSIVASIEAVSLKKPLILGKPNLFMIENVLKDLNITSSNAIMIGDRLDTDIQFAHNCNIQSILVASGVTDSNIYLNHNNLNIHPNYFMKSIKNLL
ncbi:4-nitrophenylphosphatase, putative [Hepatocystis sp. ex Piliocolobus tephrosceles]|nr:4-nitrophenylphosphatase, putative [Hepatocystis sp. ex Piliocolobus tephrosceles]